MSAAVWSFDAIGTRWEIETSAALGDAARDEVARLIDTFDREWSRFRDDSLVARLAREGGAADLPSDARAMFDAFEAMSRATSGAVNPLVGGSLEALGYDGQYTLRSGAAVSAPRDWTALLTWNDGALVLAAPATIDVGALGKGRLVDRVLDLVGRRVDGDIVVDASGDLAVRGGPIRIGLEHPFDPAKAIGTWEIADSSLCASATNRRKWGDGLHHVLDARTGVPVPTIAATWAVAGEAMIADAAATALFFDGGPQLAHEWGVAWVRMLTDGRVQTSPDCPATLFRTKG